MPRIASAPSTCMQGGCNAGRVRFYNSFGVSIKIVNYRDDQKRITYFIYSGHQLSAEIVADDEASNLSMSHTLHLKQRPVIHCRWK